MISARFDPPAKPSNFEVSTTLILRDREGERKNEIDRVRKGEGEREGK